MRGLPRKNKLLANDTDSDDCTYDKYGDDDRKLPVIPGYRGKGIEDFLCDDEEKYDSGGEDDVENDWTDGDGQEDDGEDEGVHGNSCEDYEVNYNAVLIVDDSRVGVVNLYPSSLFLHDDKMQLPYLASLLIMLKRMKNNERLQ